MRFLIHAFSCVSLCFIGQNALAQEYWGVRQLTHQEQHHELDHNENFSPDDKWLVFDARPDPDGIAKNTIIGKVHTETGESKVIYETKIPNQYGPGVGAASYHPSLAKVVFIHGLEDADKAFPYAGHRRVGAVVDERSGEMTYLDSRNTLLPFIPGALRGGTHRHQWSTDGEWVGFTYNDAIMVDLEKKTGLTHDLRTIGVAHQKGPKVMVPSGLGQVQGEWYAALLVPVTAKPNPGSEQINRAYGDWWVGTKGYPKENGYQRARAFLGNLISSRGIAYTEVFMVDVPDRLDSPGDMGPLEGTETGLPAPPKGAIVHRMTFLEDRDYPGVATDVRHWVTSSACGTWLSFLANDENGIIQVFLVSTVTKELFQATHHESHVQGTVRWNPKKNTFAYLQDNQVVLADILTNGMVADIRPITPRTSEAPFSLCWSRNGKVLAFNRYVNSESGRWMQVFLASSIAQ